MRTNPSTVEESAMPTTVLVFGDATDSWVDGLDQVYRQAVSTPWLKTFLEQLTDIVIAETKSGRLDLALKESLGHFSTLQELSDRYRHTNEKYGLVQALLLHAVRSSTLLQWVKREPQLLHPDSPTKWLGFSGGLLSLSALAISPDFDSLYENCLEAARLVFRTAKLASVRSRAIEDQPGHWGWAVLGISSSDLQKALEQFQSRVGIPPVKRAKVGVIGPAFSTVIGPPSVLEQIMKQCPAIKDLPKNALEIKALQHTLDTLTDSEVKEMIGDCLGKEIVSPQHSVYGMDQPNAVYDSYTEFLRDLSVQVLAKPLDLGQVVDSLTTGISETADVRVIQLGDTSHASFIAKKLGNKRRDVSIVKQSALLEKHDEDASLMSGRIAIVGIAGRGPKSDNIDDFWSVLMNKQDLCTIIPKDRFDVDDYYCAAHERGDKRCKMSTKYGVFMDNPGHFDSKFFKISPREALLMDPNHRQFLTSSYEALERAGYSDGKTRMTDPNRIATFYAQATDDWHKQTHPSLGCDSYTLQGIQRAFGPGRVAFSFKWEGPTYSLDAACAGTTTAIHLACMSLQTRDIDMAVAGAANILNWPHSFTCLSDSGILSDTGNCKPFRDDADGYARADFVGSVVLKRLEDAVAHNDNIVAVIAASGRNHSGNSTSITTSDPYAQERLYRKVIRNAQISPDDISYVAMHQTGTQVGDPAEMNAVANIFKHRKRSLGPIPVGAVKGNFGHSEAAAGMAELIQVVKMFETDTIPPQAGMPHTLNPRFPPLKDINIEIPSEAKPYPKHSDGKPRRILLNNFDAAGGNACMLIEEYRPKQEKKPVADTRSAHVVTLSARTKASFEANKTNLIKWLKENPAAKLADVAYTTTARKMHHPIKIGVTAASTSELITKLQSSSDAKAAPSKPESVFVFTGQGSHYAGMGSELYSTSAVFRETIDLCAAVAASQGFPSFVDMIADEDVDLSVKEAVQIQLAIVSLEIGLTAFWRSIGVLPALVMGHSLGEYAALHAAGVLSLADTLYLVGKRALLTQERCEVGSCSMLAVSASVDTVREILKSLPSSSVNVACINGPNASVVSGTANDLTEFEKKIKSKDAKIRTTFLPVPFAFHSFQMDPVLQDYSDIASGVTFSAPKIPVGSTLLGRVIDSPGVFGQEYLAQQTREPVNFLGGLESVKEKFKNAFWLELGPGPVCTSFVRSALSPSTGSVAHTLETSNSNWSSISKAVSNAYTSGVDIDWVALHKPYETALSLIKLPAYTWDMKDYWVTFKEEDEHEKVSKTQEIVPAEPQPWISTCAQYLIASSDSPKISLTFQASLSDPGFLAVIEGHRMQGIGLASGSVFCDAALTAARFAFERAGKKNLTARNMSIHEPELLMPLTKKLAGSGGKFLTTASLESPASPIANISFKVISSDQSEHDLGSIRIELCDPQATQVEWDKTSFFVKSMAESRIKASKSGTGHVLRPEVVYALFASAVEFDPSFQGIQEAYMADDFEEAAAIVSLKEDPSGTTFSFSPYWSEALAHLAGFMVNGNPTKPSNKTFIVMGFDHVKQTVDFVPSKTYLTYTRINRWEAEIAFCDAYVFDPESNKIIMQAMDLRYQRLPVVVWKNILDGGHKPAHGAKVQEPKKAAVKTSAKASVTITEPVQSTQAQPAVEETPVPQDDGSSGEAFKIFLEAIAKATGEDASIFTDDMQLSDLGVDSIMSIEVSSAVTAATGIELPATFAMDYPTIGALREEFGGDTEVEDTASAVVPQQALETTPTPVSASHDISEAQPDSKFTSTDASLVHTRATSETDDSEFVEVTMPKETIKSPLAQPIDESQPQPNVRITLLKGRSAKGRTPLYMMADGTGSIATYIHLPAFSSKTPIYGVDSPFLRCPSRLTPEIGIEGVAKHIVEALCKAHPTGPFMIGGFSAGSIIAYEVARQLPYVGRTVDGLFVIDLCCPRPATDVELTIEEVNRETDTGITIFGNAAAVDGQWSSTGLTRDHLRAYLLAMRLYHPPPMEVDKRPGRAAVIWAEKGMVNRVKDDPESMRLLAESNIPIVAYKGFMEDPKLGPFACFCPDKTADDLGPNGWDKFIGEMLCLHMDGDHLDMPMPGHVHLLHAELEKVLRYFNKEEI